jgi:hypothetical protein
VCYIELYSVHSWVWFTFENTKRICKCQKTFTEFFTIRVSIIGIKWEILDISNTGEAMRTDMCIEMYVSCFSLQSKVQVLFRAHVGLGDLKWSREVLHWNIFAAVTNNSMWMIAQSVKRLSHSMDYLSVEQYTGIAPNSTKIVFPLLVI